jgi:hypothetical protein
MTRAIVKPGSVGNDDNLLILAVPKGGVASRLAPTVSELAAATVKDVTYSLATDGWNATQDQAPATDERLTLGQTLERAGRGSASLEIKYVFGADDDIADVAFTKDSEWDFYSRYAVPYTQDIASGDEFEVWSGQLGVKRTDPPAANGVWTKTQKVFITDVVATATVSGT